MVVKLGERNKKVVGFDLPTLIETRLLVQANSGGGKSWALRRLLEQSHGHVQQIVLDLEGEFSTLRQQFDYVIAGKNGDTAADPSSAKLLARKLMEMRVSAVCDIYELPSHDRVRFVRLFLESLMSCPRKLWHPVLVVLDEAHHFCPEKGQRESSQAVIDLATRGRKRGFCAVLATQRLSKLHKDVCAETLNKMVGRTGLDIDQVRAADELGIRTKDERLKLRNCKPGEFFVYGPALRVGKQVEGGVASVTVGAVKSVHPSVGSRLIEAPPTPTPAIKKILGDLADLPEQAKKEALTLAGVRKELTEARRTITVLKKQQPVQACNHEEELRELRQRADDDETQLMEVSGKLGVAIGILEEISDKARRAMDASAFDVKPPVRKPVRKYSKDNSRLVPVSHPPAIQPVSDSSLTRPRQKILDCLLAYETLGLMSVHKSSLAALAEVSPRSGGYFNNLGALRSAGLIEYPGNGYARLTDEGRWQAQPSIEFNSLQDLHNGWIRIVGASRAKILRVLIELYPESISKPELASRIQVSAGSGGYFNNLGRLRTLGAIDYPTPGRVQATTLLFPEDLQ